MPDIEDPRNKTDFSSNKGVLPWDNDQISPGAKDSVGRESNVLKPLSGSVDIGAKGPFGGENKY